MTPHIHRRRFGAGPRAVLAIHCSLAHGGAWRGVGDALAGSCTLHALDLPNHGKSGVWDGTGDMHDTATAMAATVLDTLGPVDVIGHSFGATVALRLAVERPALVRSAVLFEPVYFAPAIADDPAFGRAYAQAMAPFRDALRADDPAAAARLFHGLWGQGPPWSALPEATRTYMTDRIAFVQHSAPFLERDSAGLLAPGRLARAAMPICLMRGALSPWATEIATALSRRLPAATEVVLPDQGHMAPLSAPGPFAAALRHVWSA